MNFRSLVKAFIPKSLFRKIEPWGHLGEAVLLNIVNGFPARNLKVIGVTGTNGKTTTSFLIHKMLQESGYKVGLITTVSYGAGDNLKPQLKHMTNVPVPLFLKQIKELKAQGIEWLVLETTSMSLAQHRVFGVPYSLAVMTNVTHEHLDYHKTFERYVDAKVKLFKLANRNRKGLRAGVINAEDPSAAKFAKAIRTSLSYGIKEGELKANKINLDGQGSHFVAEAADDKYEINSHLLGEFNIYNALAAVAVGRILNLSKSQIERGIAAVPGVPGRMEGIDAGQNFKVFVDFAITPDALAKSLQALKAMSSGRVIVVFGATGSRDRSKRPIMGEVAAKNSDLIYLTDDETYTEDGDNIRKSVMAGIEKAGGAAKTTEIGDRREAIAAAFSEAKAGDAVLLAGIGHQNYRNMGGKKQPWDERQVAHELLKQTVK